MPRLLLWLALVPIGVGHAHEKDHAHKKGGGHGPGQALSAVLPPYLEVQKALATDDLALAKTLAVKLEAAATKQHMKGLAKQARTLADASDDQVRASFAPLSAALAGAVLAHPSAAKVYRVFECERSPGRWVQREKTPKNPFAGPELRDCGAPVAPAPPAKKKKKRRHHHGH